jgi:hypothetical protein
MTSFLPVGGATANRVLKALVKAKKGQAENWMPGQPRVDEIREKMQRLKSAIARKDGRLFVLIDDLDRCSPKNMVRMFEWFKNHLDTPGCTYALGLDHRMAARAIASHYRDYIGSDAEARLEYGYRYLDKLLERDYEIQPGREAHSMAIRYLEMGDGSVIDWTRSQLGRDFAGMAQLELLIETPVLWLPRVAIRSLDTYKMALSAIITQNKTDVSLVGNDLVPAFPLWLLVLSAAHHLFSPDRVDSFVSSVGAKQPDKVQRLGAMFGEQLSRDDPRRGFIDRLNAFDKVSWPPREQMDYLYRIVREKTPRSLKQKV